jgi:hypothetical protein
MSGADELVDLDRVVPVIAEVAGVAQRLGADKSIWLKEHLKHSQEPFFMSPSNFAPRVLDVRTNDRSLAFFRFNLSGVLKQSPDEYAKGTDRKRCYNDIEGRIGPNSCQGQRAHRMSNEDAIMIRNSVAPNPPYVMWWTASTTILM